MIHNISKATTYLQTYFINPQTGKHEIQSYATGFFVRHNNQLMLVTNWHVVTGINPETPNSLLNEKTPPHYLKINLYGKNNNLSELSIPLYDSLMNPLWEEHNLGSKVDLIVYPLPLALEKYFYFIDIKSTEDKAVILETVGKEVFIIGYPFCKEELVNSFGEDTHYYLPIWKRGSIATEPKLLLNGKLILIDSLSRPGMSGSPVFIAQDKKFLNFTKLKSTNSVEDSKVIDSDVLKNIDLKSLKEEHVKEFRFLGIYSGVIGNSRLKEVSLGKCWHFNILVEILENPKKGEMPYWKPIVNEFYHLFLEQLNRNLLIKDYNGEEIRVSLNPKKPLISYSFKLI